MKYINKTGDPFILLNYVNKQTKANLHPSYNSLRSDYGGRTIKHIEGKLYKEQNGSCCYCNKFLDNDYHIEHFLPQSKFKNDEVRYDNIFLSCNSPFTCGKVKKNFLVSKYITYKNCADLFKFGTNGELLPNCSYKSTKQCVENWTTLNILQKDILMFIETLQLNHPSLIYKRKDIYKNEYIAEIARLNNDSVLIRERIIELEEEKTSDIYTSVLIFWLKENLKKIR